MQTRARQHQWRQLKSAGVSADRTMIVGAGKESTRLTVEFVRKVADLGADYVLVPNAVNDEASPAPGGSSGAY